ncbi:MULTISPECIES: 3-oxoacyl-ACP reductase family protein [Hymenobacter]|uniref:3-oxoacyl-ACP reductase FabG n=1 Tax=Hymenobacter jejuensis TaxID=2502781 RepID=A0A5B8A4B2_9BACT|nr:MULTISPECIES: 3-oxoacyl-ACP reductase family protein [Hymenobacter]MBC6990126.1 3-oxoacyl-ACP reductase FabG [Hymenobacter sp. BT491]QDA62151.1 3-oxoacyl-ACP reductase FabG [Hymenobacter jejuensis]
METQPLSGKVALVTGASRGLGHSIARTLAQAGATVIVNYHSSPAAADAVVQDITRHKGQAFAIQADVADTAAVERLFRQIRERVGAVDILVNNAGIGVPKPFLEVTLDDWQQVLQTNLTSAFLVSQAAIPAMMAKRFGRLIMISSTAAQTGGVIGPHYTASKAGLLGLVHSYASLLAQHGITANAVAPALIETDMIKDNPKITPDLIPMKRFGQPQEVADAVLLLATNGYINGQTLNVNGGLYMS